MKKLIAIFSLLLVLTSVTPVYAALDYGGLVKCDGVVDKNNPNEKARNQPCDFTALISMVNSIIKWVFGLTIPIFVAIFAYAGFLYMTPKAGNRELSNKMLWAALKGFVIMLLAWFIVSTLLKWVTSTTTDSGKSATTLLDQQK